MSAHLQHLFYYSVAVLVLEPSHGSLAMAESRGLTLTPGAPVRGDLLVGLPLTLLLPSIGYNTEYKSRYGAAPAEERDDTAYNSVDLEYSSNLVTGPLLSRLDAFFHYLGVHSNVCRQRIVCELAQRDQQFSPLSNYLSSLFRKAEDSFVDGVGDGPSCLRWEQYSDASRAAEGGCQQYAASCPRPTEDMLNMPVLRLWQLLARRVNIRVDDF